ncbi:hypothetical protein HMPREF1870_02800 [Bacteroidales bacterium KA00344]|nr:hypothetical protein HMPREF1870_02800 [Bacteroidales bacterium KA00344]
MAHGDNHFDEMIPRGEKIIGLVEQAVTQTGTDEHTHKDIKEERLKLFFTNLLFLVEAMHEQITEQKPHEPTHGIPPDAEATDVENHFAGVPNDV